MDCETCGNADAPHLCEDCGLPTCGACIFGGLCPDCFEEDDRLVGPEGGPVDWGWEDDEDDPSDPSLSSLAEWAVTVYVSSCGPTVPTLAGLKASMGESRSTWEAAGHDWAEALVELEVAWNARP